MRAYKVQKKAKRVGFDWDDVSFAFEKVNEELKEVKDAYISENKENIEDEIGDLLFSCVNVARFLGIDGEEALNSTINKFISRFSYIEMKALEKKLNLNEMSLEDMDILWEEAKKTK
ncbi:Nucleoside triphosphate pyrophosphohydrolase [Clostridioides difficile]|nr:Nucleoside triphosphate pyrophosphohydrolase [Clostridioides difficile]